MKILNNFKLILILAILFLPARKEETVLFAQSQKLKVIREIQIKGNRNFKERQVRELIKTRPKDFFSETALREDIQSILASGNFEDAQVQTQDLPVGVKVIFTVKEKPIVKKIDFTGNKKIGKRKLKDEISLKTKEGYDPGKLASDVKKILSLYGEKGYPDAKVEPFTTFDDTGKEVSVNFVIKEGNRVLIERVDFEGAHSFPHSKLRRLIKTKKRKVFNSETLSRDREELERFYKNNGYAKVKVSDVKFEYNPERTRMTLFIPVSEGRRYVTGTFQFVGQVVYTEADLKKAVEMKSGKLYNQEKLDATLQNLRELYLEKGYLNASIEPEEKIDEKEGRINYLFRIVEGAIFYIDRIYVEGHKKTKEKVFRREILLKPGDPFSSSKLKRSMEKIMNLGFIDDVKPDVQPGREPDKVDLIMEVVEGKPGSLAAGAGFSSADGLVGQLQLSHSNFLGLAQRLSLMWEFGSRRQNYEISWTEPWAFNKPVSLGVDVHNTIRERLFDADASPDYRETRRGGGLRVGPRFSDIYQLIFSYSFSQVQIHNVKPQFIGLIKEETNTTSSFSTELIRDTRDYWFDATRGNRQSVFTQFSGGPVLQGDTHLVKTIFSTSWFWTLFKIGNYPFVFSINNRIGGVQAYPPSPTVPIFERFYVGGADSVRGYLARGEIGPLDGGNAFMVANAEYKIPLYVENKRRILQLVLFADIGGAWRSAKDILLHPGQSRIERENERFLKSAVGFGLRITTPVFPIRLDWGYGLNHRAGEELTQLHFTLGSLF